MKTRAGLWIDHRKANIVAVTDAGETATLVISKTEKQLRRSGDSPLKGDYESQQVPAPDSRQRTFTMHANLYYDTVIAAKIRKYFSPKPGDRSRSGGTR